MTSVVSSGFREDCSEFLCDFAKLETPEFQSFCLEWKRTNFQYIFHGRNADAEMVEYVGEVFYTVKKFFFYSKNTFERIGAFYLLYTLYFKQPLFMFCKIRLTLSEWRTLKDFAKLSFNGLELPQITIILWKLFKADAFRFVQDELEQGFDRFFVKSSNGNFDNVSALATNKVLDNELQKLTTPGGFFNAMEILEMGYNEMKEALDDGDSSVIVAIHSDRIPQSSLMESLRVDIDSLGAMMRATEHQISPRKNVKTKDDEPMGDKRYLLRRKAYKLPVQQKLFRIAGRKSPQSDESDDPSNSHLVNKCITGECQKTRRTISRGTRNRKSQLSNDDGDDHQ